MAIDLLKPTGRGLPQTITPSASFTPTNTAGLTNIQNANPTPLPEGTILRGGINPTQLPGGVNASGNTGITGGATKTTPATGSGNYEQDFWNIYGGLPPSAKNLEDNFSKYQALYPGAQLKKNASGYADAIILPNGQIIDTQRNSGYDRSDAWQWNVVGTGSSVTPYDGNQFSDPSTAFYESLLKQRVDQLGQPINDPNQQALAKLLEQQTAYLQQQQQQQAAANDQLKARQAQAQVSTDKYVAYANQRAGELQSPAYTPSEQNILKTQATDPIEADRQAALKRALDNVGSRGFDPSSGIAQDLLRQVNGTADVARNTSQNALAVRQIDEQRSRQQEAQALLAAIPQAQMAAANGDLSFLQSLNQAVNSLGAQAGQSATQQVALGQQARDQATAQQNELLARAGQLYQLPLNAAQLGMAALGQAPNPADLTQQTISLAQLASQQGANSANFWAQLGASFAPLFGK